MVEFIRKIFGGARPLISVMAVLFLVACDDAEERANRHFENAVALAAKGDIDRATVEFRNVFRLDAAHSEAREAYAAMQREAGNVTESIGQFLRLLEQQPDHLDARIAVVEMFAEIGAWNELDTQVNAAIERFPDVKIFELSRIVSQYRLAVENRDSTGASQYADLARQEIDAYPDVLPLRRTLIDDAMRRGFMEDALFHIDHALAFAPTERSLLPVRLSVLAALGDTFEMEAQLRETIEQFPESEEDWLTLVRFLVSQDRIDEGEETLRELHARSQNTEDNDLLLIEYLLEFRDAETALAEIERMMADGEIHPELRTRRATIVFEVGSQEDAIGQMQLLIDELGDTPDSREFRVALAQMHMLNGDVGSAKAIVDTVLQEDNAHVEARKMQADWLIAGDKTGEAIAALRIALEQDPSDPQIYALLARAHERDGNDELVGEMLALAVEASDNAAGPSVAYGRYLVARDKLGPAESIAIDALRRDPTNPTLLTLLGQTYLGLREWGRMEQVINTLRNFDEPGASAQADVLTAEMLRQQERAEESVAFLQGLVAEGGNRFFNADAAIVRAHLGRDLPERALQYIEEQLVERPEDVSLLGLQAATLASVGQLEAAATSYQNLTVLQPEEVSHWTGLYRVLYQLGQQEQADLILQQGLEVVSRPATLQWIQASTYERSGDLESAIAIYEKMYAADSGNTIIANNLANLLVSVDTSSATVARAYSIARRLSASNLPPYQDTYGWIAVLRGDFSDAVRVLEPAAAAMAGDAKVQYHLARAYDGANLVVKAQAQYEVVLGLTEDGDPRDFVEDARQRLERLHSLIEAEPEAVLGE